MQDKKPYWLGRALVNTYTRILKNNNSLLQGDISKGDGAVSTVAMSRGRKNTPTG
nr:MAG TPA: hypothetical protein [Caudoviricetes sp.]